jgi:hypothetical protein
MLEAGSPGEQQKAIHRQEEAMSQGCEPLPALITSYHSMGKQAEAL